MIITPEAWKAIGTMVGAAILVMAKPILDAVKKKSKIIFARTKIESQRKIQVILDEMRARLQVDRVDIFEYSNGEKTLGGFPFLFGTMTFESIAPHIKSTKREMSRFPTSWFAALLYPILDVSVRYCLWRQNGTCVIENSKNHLDINAGMLLKGDYMESNMLIKFSNNISDGIISISSYNEIIDFNEEEMEQILSDVHKVLYHLKLKR